MIKKRTAFVVLLALFAVSAKSKSLTEIWKTMPDSILSFVDRSHRLEMVEFMGMNLKGEVDNQLGGKSVMDTLTNDYIHVTTSPSSVLEIRKLPTIDGDSIVCLVKTFGGAGSELWFYTMDWEALHQKTTDQEALILKIWNAINDDVSSVLADLRTCQLGLLVDKDQLEVCVKFPLKACDKTTIGQKEKRIYLKWNGELFK